MTNYIEINRVNHLTKFFSIESDGLRITQNCLELDKKETSFFKILILPLETIDLYCLTE